MKNIGIYCDSTWSLGSIYKILEKELYKYNVNTIAYLDWATAHELDLIKEIDKYVDVWLTSPLGITNLVQYYSIPVEKIVVTIHGIIEIPNLIIYQNYLNRFKAITAVSTFLIEETKKVLPIEPILTIPGFNSEVFNNSSDTISESISNIGFAATLDKRYEDNKRGFLVENISKLTNLGFKSAQRDYNYPWYLMRIFYSSVDIVILSSKHEGIGMPMLEAGCAGKLVLTTDVGLYSEIVGKKGAVVLPIGDTELVSSAVSIIDYFKNNLNAYYDKCLEIKEHSKTYAWKYRISNWLEVINT